ncbi:MAG: mechanosensitive ion channel [Lachnospiraceae bacterium]|nr:mechanosensitive ion channel [Lachnospiraceae bacterium]
MKKNKTTLIIIEIILFAVCILLMVQLQIHLFQRNADREMELTFEDTDRIMEQAVEDMSSNFDSYELIHQAKAKMAKYYIRNDEDTGYTGVSMSKLKIMLNVSNVFLTDSDGNIIYQAEAAPFENLNNEYLPFFDEMDVPDGSGGISQIEYILVEKKDDPENMDLQSFCAATLSNGYYVVVEDDASGLELQEETNSYEELLPRITLGRNGFVFSIEDDGYVSAFSDEDEVQIRDIKELGIKMGDLKDGFKGYLTLDGDSYYCGIKHYEDYGCNIICAIPAGEITSNVFVVTVVPLFVVFIFLTLQTIYSLMLMGEYRGKDDKGRNVSLRMYLFKKMAFLLALSVLFTVAISLYVQGLYAMYLQTYSNREEAEKLSASLHVNEEVQKQTSEDYYNDLELLSQLAARFISNNPNMTTRHALKDIAKNLGAEHILLYDSSGTVAASDEYYRGLKLSKDPEDLSYQFRKVLTGTQVFAQQEVDKTYLEEPYRYVGAIVTDENDELNGFVQLAFSPDYLGTSLNTSTVETLPSTFSGRNNAFVFILDSKEKTFLYYPNEEMVGDKASDYGLTDEMMQDEFTSRVLFDGQERLLYCVAWEKDLIFTAASVSVITMESISRGIYISLAGIMILCLFFVIILISAGNGEVVSTETARERWNDESQKKLIESLAAGHIMKLINSSLFVFSGVVCFIMLMKDIIFKSRPALLNLLNSQWNTGIHIFSVTACWISLCIIFFTMSLMLMMLEMTGRLVTSRGVTVIRMLMSFIRYIAVIGGAFNCAMLLGAPMNTLLASAGLLTVVVGLGAQSLVTDILAGLFIIFEKAFKVGDIIKMGGWRGRVLEIGIRNTRVMDMDENSIKIIHNSSMNEIVNLSDLPTCIYSTIGTEYSDNLEEIEEIIKRELPYIQERIPEAIEGPLYRGVWELADSAVVLKFMTKCANEDYYTVIYAVNRELKLMFDRNGINVPFPQVVLNTREEETEKTTEKNKQEKENDDNDP